MANVWLKLKEIYSNKEKQQIGERFINIMEIIYAIILACGVVRIVDVGFEKPENISVGLVSSLLICIFVLVRFFFAPSKNIKILGLRGWGMKWTIMLFDVPVLIIQSFIYYYMCSKIDSFEAFYQAFFVLLFVNAMWLILIRVRLWKEDITYAQIWTFNNLAFVMLYLISLQFVVSWVLLFVMALINCLIDLLTTYSDYFQDPE